MLSRLQFIFQKTRKVQCFGSLIKPNVLIKIKKKLKKKNIKTQNRHTLQKEKENREKERQRKNFGLSQMVEREKSEMKVRLCHHQTTVPSTGMVSVFSYRTSAYSLPLQILFLQFERLKLLTIAFPIRIRILNLQYFYVFEFKTCSSPYLIFQGS